jgi:hypothetical protein
VGTWRLSFRQELEARGYKESQNLTIDYRWEASLETMAGKQWPVSAMIQPSGQRSFRPPDNPSRCGTRSYLWSYTTFRGTTANTTVS